MMNYFVSLSLIFPICEMETAAPSLPAGLQGRTELNKETFENSYRPYPCLNHYDPEVLIRTTSDCRITSLNIASSHGPPQEHVFILSSWLIQPRPIRGVCLAEATRELLQPHLLIDSTYHFYCILRALKKHMRFI